MKIAVVALFLCSLAVVSAQYIRYDVFNKPGCSSSSLAFSGLYKSPNCTAASCITTGPYSSSQIVCISDFTPIVDSIFAISLSSGQSCTAPISKVYLNAAAGVTAYPIRIPGSNTACLSGAGLSGGTRFTVNPDNTVSIATGCNADCSQNCGAPVTQRCSSGGMRYVVVKAPASVNSRS